MPNEPYVEQIMVADGDGDNPDVEEVKYESIHDDGGGTILDSLPDNTNDISDTDLIVSKENDSWVKKTALKIWTYVKTKLGISDQGSTGKYLNEQGNFTTPPNTTYGVVSTSTNGLAPKVTDTSKYLKGDGTWATPTNTTYGVVSKTANGLAPQLPNETTTTKYLRQDGSWAVPPDNNTTTGTSYNAGSCPDNTTFATNGSVARAYSSLNSNKSKIIVDTIGGVSATISAGGTWVNDVYNTSTYKNQGYTFAGAIIETTSDFMQVGYRMNGNNVRVSVHNSYSSQQTTTVGGRVIFIK